MIRGVLKRVHRALVSPALALGLIAFITVWSVIATAIPQSSVATPDAMAAWTTKYRTLEPAVEAVGLHRAFSAPIFIAAVVLLAISSGLCAWGRTKAAAGKARRLKAAALMGPAELQRAHDISIPLDTAASRADVLERAASVFAALGVKTRRRQDVVLAVSPSWSVWGSAVFHWALVALVLTVFASLVLRSEGAMGVAVGATVPDQEESYFSVETGRLHDWARVKRSIRIDDFDPAGRKGDLELGAVPTVTVLDADGRAVITQQVYPNKKLHAGSVSIYSPMCGLAVTVEIEDAAGRPLGRVTQLVDFSQEASGGTVPVKPMAATDDQGRVVMRLSATVPLDKDPHGGFGEWIPEQPKAHLVLSDGSGTRLLDRVVNEGETAAIEGGGTLRVADVGWYAVLVVVDDPTIPLIYASMIVAMLGLTLSVAMRQQIVAAAVVDGADGPYLAVQARLWRNVSTTADEIRGELESALATKEGRTS